MALFFWCLPISGRRTGINRPHSVLMLSLLSLHPSIFDADETKQPIYNVLWGGESNLRTTWNVGQCPTRWPPCRIQVAPSVQRRKVWLMPTTRCRAVTLPRRETRWNLQGCPKLTKRSQPLVDQSLPYCGDMWRRYCCLTSFFPIVDICLSCEDIARQSCVMVPDGDI